MQDAADAPHVNLYDDLPEAGFEADDGAETQTAGRSDEEWLRLATLAYKSSADYMDESLRGRWNDAIRAFNSQHATGSRYNNPAYDKRSRVFRPKTRSAIRKNEAAAAAAFFSSLDIVSIDPLRSGDQVARANADMMKHLLQYRLTTADYRVAVPWYMMVMGGIQDAQTVGVVISRQFWEPGENKPAVRLIAAENLKLSPTAEWHDPINTSPYVVEDVPMYAMDVRERMATGEWYEYAMSEIRAAAAQDDSTRSSRQAGQQDPAAQEVEPDDYQTVWVQRHIHRYGGQDWVFYVLDNQRLLTSPQPLTTEVWHGDRDYVMGLVVIEAHRLYPRGVAELGMPIQEEINELTNQGLDNTKFVMNKRWFVKRGQNVDVASLIRNVPGGVTMTNDPDKDAREVNWPDITPSVFEQQNRLAADFSDMIGDYNAALSQLLTRSSQQPATSLMHMQQAPVPLVDYLLRTFVETWVQPVLRQLVKLEQYYESDHTILALAADKAQVFQRFGIDQVTDDMLMRDLSLTVNMVFGALNPQAKLSRFTAGLGALSGYAKAPIPGANATEIAKEVFALMGYQDGARFLDESPEVARLKSALQQKDQALAEMTRRLNDKQGDMLLKKDIADDKNRTAIVTTVLKHEHEKRLKLADAVVGEMNAERQAQVQAAEAKGAA